MFSIFHEISHYLLKYLSFYLIQGQEWANNCKLCNCNDGSQIDVFYDLYKWLTVVRGIQEKCSMQLGQSMEYQRVHNTSARIVDIYFDANQFCTPAKVFRDLKRWKPQYQNKNILPLWVWLWNVHQRHVWRGPGDRDRIVGHRSKVIWALNIWGLGLSSML